MFVLRKQEVSRHGGKASDRRHNGAGRAARVIKIEAAEKPRNAHLRVAAYTRVSSDSDDQLNSFAAQNRYYAELISRQC